MEEYKVILDFTDLEDGNRIYRAGDAYPYHNAADPSEERVESLLTGKNKRGEPLIESVSNDEESDADEEVDEPQEDAADEETVATEEEITEEDTESLEDLTVEELKKRLDKEEIEYKSNDNKKTLIKLLSE